MVRRYARSRDPTRAHWKMKSSYSYKVHPRNRRVGGRVVSDKSWSKMKRRSAQKIGLTTTGKVLARGVPYLGWALLAYDVYTFAESLQDKQSVKSPEAHVDPFMFENITHHDYVQGYNTTPISVWRTM